MKDLSFGDAKKVIDAIDTYFRENGIEDGRINIAGGEPLMYRRLDDIIDYIAEKNIKVSIITNGAKLTEERIASWSGKVAMIGISIDSITAEADIRIGRCDSCNNHLELEHLVEQLFPLIFAIGFGIVYLVYIIHKLLDSEHITVIGNCDARHTICDSLIYKFFDARLSIEERVLGVSM
jgi:wyosine [tRNA(Phe)-imidazoG37] synthetase (radical SAM superfamily)